MPDMETGRPGDRENRRQREGEGEERPGEERLGEGEPNFTDFLERDER